MNAVDRAVLTNLRFDQQGRMAWRWGGRPMDLSFEGGYLWRLGRPALFRMSCSGGRSFDEARIVLEDVESVTLCCVD